MPTLQGAHSRPDQQGSAGPGGLAGQGCARGQQTEDRQLTRGPGTLTPHQPRPGAASALPEAVTGPEYKVLPPRLPEAGAAAKAETGGRGARSRGVRCLGAQGRQGGWVTQVAGAMQPGARLLYPQGPGQTKEEASRGQQWGSVCRWSGSGRLAGRGSRGRQRAWVTAPRSLDAAPQLGSWLSHT